MCRYLQGTRTRRCSEHCYGSAHCCLENCHKCIIHILTVGQCDGDMWGKKEIGFEGSGKFKTSSFQSSMNLFFWESPRPTETAGEEGIYILYLTKGSSNSVGILQYQSNICTMWQPLCPRQNSFGTNKVILKSYLQHQQINVHVCKMNLWIKKHKYSLNVPFYLYSLLCIYVFFMNEPLFSFYFF